MKTAKINHAMIIHPIIKGIRAIIQNFYPPIKQIKGGYMAQKLSFQTDFIISKGNLIAAKGVLDTGWSGMSTAEKDTWFTNKQFIKDTDGYPTFLDYYLRTFASVNSNVTTFTTISLGAGTSNNYADRATRTWSAS